MLIMTFIVHDLILICILKYFYKLGRENLKFVEGSFEFSSNYVWFKKMELEVNEEVVGNM